MPKYQNEQLLGWWLDGQLNVQQREEFEQRCLDDEAFAQQVASANMFSLHAQHYVEQEVPRWDRASTFSAPEKAKWWQWQGLSGLSIALSVVAMVMVLSGLQIKVDDGSLTVSFAAKQSHQDIERLVNDKLQDFQHSQQQTQQLALTNFTQTMQQQQLDASSQLTQYLLSSSRKERREDFAELIKFINEQRSDDQLFYARQINQLQQDIYTDPAQSGLNSSKE
ncbi:hypothetical protein [Paraglaciecola hydrolytica]|uniref:Uncharacterized protein n=1 Tax=Paraglaciecola hydrolytica TaxID=1799789 RepID=A0A148KL23_9ALTE|nr:hypothetical protein [Paraglaciecola hydrolytica]KXI26980.1 hypothetical protein AX660_02480 [Paraglaciecola hydrolytica]